MTYSFWTNNSLYQFNDPDHTVLYHSLVDGRSNTSLNEARSRYNASIISGTVMLLSDNYGPDKNKKLVRNSKNRALRLANNKKLNELSRQNKAFIPVYMNDTSHLYYLAQKEKYFALFNFSESIKSFTINPKQIHFPKDGTILDMNTNKTHTYNKTINITLKPYDSRIFQMK